METAFEVPRTIYKLVFEDEVWAGLEVCVRSLSFAELFAARDILNGAWTADHTLAADQVQQKMNELHELFIAHLADWNLVEDGQPVPPTVEGLRSQESTFVSQIVGAWRNTVLGISVPLARPSRDGGQSLEESIPMEPLSPSLAS